MDSKTASSGFKDQVRLREPKIMFGSWIRYTTMTEMKPDTTDDQDGRQTGPGKIDFGDARKHPLKLLLLLTSRHDITSGLLVAGRGRPARGLEQGNQVLRRDGPTVEDVGTGAFCEQFMDRSRGNGLRGHDHSFPASSIARGNSTLFSR